ncbi:hypothetical protein KY285_004982 [Solanum tuberosum]|nr:hypothetical protein KY285_004982 [Solanum tuberosum]
MDEVSKNNRAWNTRYDEIRNIGFTFEVSVKHRKREEERDQDMAHMKIQIDILKKHLVDGQDKVNLVGVANKYEE